MKTSVILAGVAVLALIALAVSIAPRDPLFMANTGPEGASWLNEINAKPVYSPADLEPRGLLIVLPDTRLPEDVIAAYLSMGKVLILEDAEIAAAPCSLGDASILDEISKYRSRYEPVAAGPAGEAVLESPRPLYCTSAAESVLETSQFSWLDLNGDGAYTQGEPLGPFTVAARWGNATIVSSRSLLYNEFAPVNKGFVEHLAEGRPVLVDQTRFSSPAYRIVLAASRVPDLALLSASLAVGGLSYAAARRL